MNWGLTTTGHSYSTGVTSAGTHSLTSTRQFIDGYIAAGPHNPALTEVSRNFEFLQAYSGAVPYNKPQLFTSTTFQPFMKH
jgi:hypothetical protein